MSLIQVRGPGAWCRCKMAAPMKCRIATLRGEGFRFCCAYSAIKHYKFHVWVEEILVWTILHPWEHLLDSHTTVMALGKAASWAIIVKCKRSTATPVGQPGCTETYQTPNSDDTTKTSVPREQPACHFRFGNIIKGPYITSIRIYIQPFHWQHFRPQNATLLRRRILSQTGPWV